MSDGRPEDMTGSGGPLGEMPTESPRRAASLVLREDNVREQRAVSMEAANRSLGDALRFTYRIIQLLMIVLAGLFFFSGFQQVNEGETGLRVEFGKLKGGALSSGFHFSLPYPMGQLEIVDTRQQSLEIDESFWPEVRDKTKGIEQLGIGSPALKPGQDGSLITGDGNVLHTQWSVLYRRADPIENAANLQDDSEERLVRAVVERAVVQTVAELTIDEILKPGAASQGSSSIESRVRRIAQDALDRLETGIRIDETILRHKSPPARIRSDFELVNQAVEKSDKAISEATSERSVTLTSLAGTAYQPLLDLIDTLEQASALGQERRVDELLDTIRRVLDGEYNSARVVEIDGKEYSSVRFSGDLSKLISNARQQRSVRIAQAKSEAERFRAQAQQYRANPRVFLYSELADAWESFLGNDTVSVLWVPPGTDPLVWRLTLDPEHMRQIERAVKQRDLVRTTQERLQLLDEINPY